VEAGFIFRGTVQRAKASTVPDVKADSRTAVVRVDDVIAAPATLARTAGHEVTVVLERGGKALRPGDHAVFHASGISFGDDIAVRATVAEAPAAVGRGSIGAARAAAAPLAAAGTVDPVQAHRDLLLKQSLDRADVVVAGTITQVRVAPETEAAMTAAPPGPVPMTRRRGTVAAAGPAGAPRRISEHDPIWHEAVVNVESVEKGSTNQKQVVVRFPGSNDVRWRYHPKLRPGQQAVFLLNAETTPPPRARAAARGTAARFTAAPVPTLQSAAMQPTGEPQPISTIERVRQLLGTPATTSGAARAPQTSARTTVAAKTRARRAARTRRSRTRR
jgi:hypothetical protein